MSKAPAILPPSDGEPDTALPVTVHLLTALKRFVNLDEPVVRQAHGEAFKLMAKLSRTISRLEFAAKKK